MNRNQKKSGMVNCKVNAEYDLLLGDYQGHWKYTAGPHVSVHITYICITAEWQSDLY